MKNRCLFLVFSMLFMYGCGSSGSSSSDTSDTGATLTESEAAGIVGYVMTQDISATSTASSMSAPVSAVVTKDVMCEFATGHACSNVPSGMACEVTSCDDSGLDVNGIGIMSMAMTMTMTSTSLCNVTVNGTFYNTVNPVFTIAQHPPTSGAGSMYGTITVGSQTVTCGSATSPITFVLATAEGDSEPQPEFAETEICSFNDGTPISAEDVISNMGACM